VWPAFFIAFNYHARYNLPTARLMLWLMWLVLSGYVSLLAGSGVKSQGPTHISFPEGLAGSTQYTISLPVSRAVLIVVRAGIGLIEGFAATLIIAFALWQLFPSIAASMTLADYGRLVLSTLVWLPLPFCASLLAQAFLVEPLSLILAGYGLTLLLWLLHKISPAVDVVRAFGAESPLLTHRLPVSQLATAGLLAVTLLLVAVWAVQRREY
jgi:hypothetical protein